MIEKNIHQIWIGPYEIPKREKNYIEINKEMNNSFNHFLWTDNNLPKLPDKIQEIYDYHMKNQDYAEVSDILRLYLIKEYGGIYIDIDTEPMKPFDVDNTNYELLICYHDNNPTDYTTPNEAIAAKKNSDAINYIYNEIDIKNSHSHHQWWIATMMKKYLNLEYETDNNIVKELCEKSKINYFPYNTLQSYFAHRRLHSADPVNKENFRIGNINYTETRGW